MATLKFLLDVSAPNAQRVFDGVRGRLDGLDRSMQRTRELSVGNAEAMAKITRTQLAADKLRERLGRMDITVRGAQTAELRLLELEATADRLHSKLGDETVRVNTSAASKALAALSRANVGGTLAKAPLLAGLAPLLAPAAATLGGAGIAAGIGLGGAGIAGGGALAAFAAVAKPVVSDALKAQKQVQAAQDAYSTSITKIQGQYAYSMSLAKTKAQRDAAYAAEQKKLSNAELARQQALSKAYAGMSPQQIALAKQLEAMAAAWDKFKAAETPVVSGALQPWLKSVTDLVGKLRPIINAVSPVIGKLGTQFDTLIDSSAFTSFRNFIASTGSNVVAKGGNALIDFISGLVFLLPQFAPLINKAANGVSNWGDAFVRWASSQKAADEIKSFMAWFQKNGPAVAGFLTNLGKALGRLLPGLSAGGALELKVLGDFLGWVAKLPKGVAAPLAEVAGAALVLAKLPGGTKVINFAVNLAGKGVAALLNLLGIGGGKTATLGVAAGGMQTAADTMVSAARAMQAAADTMAGGSVAGGTEGAAGGAAGKAAGKGSVVRRVAGRALGVAGVAGLVTEFGVKPALQGVPSGTGGKNWWDNPFGLKKTQDSWSHLWNTVYTNFMRQVGSPVASWFSTSLPHFFTSTLPRSLFAAFVAPGKMAVQGLWSGLKSQFTNMNKDWGHLLGTLGGAFKGAGKWLTGPGKNLIFGLGHGIFDAARGLASWLTGSIFSPLGSFFSHYGGGAVKWLFGHGKSAIFGWGHGIFDAARGLWSWLTGSVFSPLGSFFTHYGGGAIKWLFGHGKNTVFGWGHGIFDAARGLWSWLTGSIFTPLGNFFAHYGGGAVKWLFSHGKNTVFGWGHGLYDAARGIPGWLTGSIFAPLGNFFSHYGGGAIKWLFGHGKDILFGLGHGLYDAAQGIGNWMTDIGHRIVNAVKHFFGIKSPSTVMAGIGYNVMGGLIKGLFTKGDEIPGVINKIFGGMPQAAGALIHKGLLGVTGLPGKLLGELSKLGGQIGSWLSGLFGGGGDTGSRTHSAAVAQKYARSQLARFGWGQDQMTPLLKLWNQESGWNPYAVNPSSGAAGIAQSLGHGHVTLGDYVGQVNWGLGYIKGRYGSPAAAWGHEVANNWYGIGGLITEPIFGIGRSGRTYGFGERGVERVTPGAGPARPERSGPLITFGDVVVKERADVGLLAAKLSFAVAASGLGS